MALLRSLRALGPRRLARSFDLAAPSPALPSPHALEEAQRAVLAQAQAQAQTQIQTQAESSLPVAPSPLASYLQTPRLFLHPSIPRALTLAPLTASGAARGFSDVAAATSAPADPELFVGNLGWNVTDEEFAETFSKFEGFISSRLQRNAPGGKCRGFGFVSFVTQEDAQIALSAMQGAEIRGRSVIVQFSQERKPSAVVFVRSLAWAVDSEGLRSAFAHCGKIEYSRVLYHAPSGRSRGSGVIEFESVEAAQRAVDSMQGHKLDERPIRVDFATPRQVERVQKDREEGGHAAASAVEGSGDSTEEISASTGAHETEGEAEGSSSEEAAAEEQQTAEASGAEAPEAPETAETPEAPETPETAETPETPEAPEASGAGGQASPAHSSAQ